jgi:subtilisin family serine protease
MIEEVLKMKHKNLCFLLLIILSLNTVSGYSMLRNSDRYDHSPFLGTGSFGFQSSSSSQIIPWGISRVNGDVVQTIVDESPIKVAIIDTGLKRDHEDFEGLNVAWGLNTFYEPSRYCNTDTQ